MTTEIHASPAGARPSKRSLPLVAPRVEPKVRGEPAFRLLDRALRSAERHLAHGLSDELNPFAHSGAIANTLFAIACLSGIILLVWYQTSVYQAYASTVAMGRSPWGAGLVRSLHRYSSDGCMAFVLLHALRLFAARRFGGARWLAWVTGLLAVGLLWLVGWLGYWLVWDERGQAVALGTARLFDVLPIFAEPLSRSFLTDTTLSSLLFFVVFFLHMLLPLAMGVALWLHIARLSRPAFFTKRWLTLWVTASLVLISLLAPADVAGPARMAVRPGAFTLDGWYLLPLLLTDRLSGSLSWVALLLTGCAALSLPWTLVGRRARPAQVIEARCNACERCTRDCPYDAIRMVPGEGSENHARVAAVDPDKCVGCGICAGSCDSAAIGLPWLDTVRERHALDRRIESLLARGPAPRLAFVCEENMPGPELADHEIVAVPCAGWVHPLTVERALRRGARDVTIATCPPGACRYREGAKWTEQRMTGTREPRLRSEKVSARRVLLPRQARLPRAERLVRAGGLAVAASGLVYATTRVQYALPARPGELVVSFKHSGASQHRCRKPTAEEMSKVLPHMRPAQICDRGRADVRVRVTVDGSTRLERAYAPSGLWSDGSSVALERLPLDTGKHRVRVEIGTGQRERYDHESERTVETTPDTQAVVLFEGSAFRWVEP